MARDNPGLAHKLAPGDGRFTGLLAQQRFVLQPDGKDGVTIAGLAQRALRQDPTSVPAATVLGYQMQLRGDMAQARRLFAYSQRLSRRNFQTQLWMIEDATERGDIAGALRHYDIALRTSKTAPDVLFPILTAASTEPAIRSQLVPMLANGPAWTARFITYAAGNTADPSGTAKLFAGLRKAGVPVPADASAAIITHLVARNAFDEAWRYYALVRQGSDQRRSRDPKFVFDQTPSPFDWMAVGNLGLAVSIQAAQRGGAFVFSVRPSTGGVMLRQLQMLPPGSHRLTGRSSGIEQETEALPYWVLTCIDGRELGRVLVPNSAQAGGVFAGQFRVPAGCAAQTLSLIARPSDKVSGVTGQIDAAQLVAAKGL